ncbi:MAG: cytochrome c [Terriglobales bacterium]
MRARIVLNAALALALIAVAAVSWFLRADAARPNAEFLPEMVRSARYNAFSANPNFPDGKTLQPPPPGTVARGYMPLPYTATPQDAQRAGKELVSPLADENTLQRGAFVFANFCATCHGADGKGMGPVAQRGYPPPPSLFAERATNMPSGQMFHVLTYGQNNMPAYAGQLSREDRWAVVLYLRSLQRQAAQAQPAASAAAAQGGR